MRCPLGARTDGTEKRHSLQPSDKKCADSRASLGRVGTSGRGNEIDVYGPWMQSLPAGLCEKSTAAGHDGGWMANDGGLWGDGNFLRQVLHTAPASFADRARGVLCGRRQREGKKGAEDEYL